MVTSKAAIHIESQATPPIIPVVQADTGRSILFTLADFTIPTGATATYYIQKPSGNAVYNNAVIEGNTITANLTAQAIAEIGDNYGQVRIAKDGEVVTSFDFILLVKEFRGIDAVESTTEMNIFDKAVQNAMANIDGMLPNIIAPVFDASTTYTAGDYVIYSGKLYQFTAAHTGAWTGSDAEELTAGDALNDLEEETTSLKEDISPMQTATASDVGKALKAKTVEDGKVTAWEFGDTGATTDIHVDGTSLVINTSVVDGNEVNF